MFLGQVKLFLYFPYIIILVRSEPLLPSKAEQVNLLTKVHELFEQMKSMAKTEQTDLEKYLKNDIEMYLEMSILSMNLIGDLALSRLDVRKNAVCSIDVREKVSESTRNVNEALLNCISQNIHSIVANSRNQTENTEIAIKIGEDLLEKLNLCGTEKGLKLIACYKEIIKNDVSPVKTVLSESMDRHREMHADSFKLKSQINNCIWTTVNRHREWMEENVKRCLEH